MAESKAVADYYAKRRQVPASQVFGFELPATEAMTRAQYVEHLQKPLLKSLESSQLFTFGSRGKPEGAPTGGEPQRRLVQAAIRYAVLCYGVPTKILRDPKLVGPQAHKLPAAFQRKQAAAGSQIALLPLPPDKP